MSTSDPAPPKGAVGNAPKSLYRKSVVVRFFVLFYGLALLMIMAMYLVQGIAVNWQ